MKFTDLMARFSKRMMVRRKGEKSPLPNRDPIETASNVVPIRKSFRTGNLDIDSFTVTVQEIVDDKDARDIHLHILSLTDFRRAIAGKWNRINHLIEIAVAAIVRNHMDPEVDLFTQLDAEISLLAFPTTPLPVVRTRVATIARDLAQHLFGEAEIDGRRPQVVITSIPLRHAVTDDGSLDRGAIHVAVAEAAAEMMRSLSPQEDNPQSGLTPQQQRGLEALMQEMKMGAAASLSGFAAVTQPEEPQSSDAAELTAALQQTESRMTGDTKLSLLWSPTWVTAQKTMGAFHARVFRIDSDRAPPLIGSHAYKNTTPIEALTIDRFVATRAAQELKKLHYANRHLGLMAPVHWTSLAPKWRDCIRIPIMDCPHKARQKLLKIEILGLSSAVSSHIFDNSFEPMEAMGCDIMVRLPLTDIEIMPKLRLVKAVGIDLSELGDQDDMPDGDLLKKITSFRNAAKTYRIRQLRLGRRPQVALVGIDGVRLFADQRPRRHVRSGPSNPAAKLWQNGSSVSIPRRQTRRDR